LKILLVVVATVIGGILTTLAASVVLADARLRADAFQVADILAYDAQYVQSGAIGDMAALKSLNPLRAAAENLLKRKHIRGLEETLVGFDLERVGSNTLRLTVTTEMGYPESLIRLVGLTRRDLRAASSREIVLRCMPPDIPEAHGPKGPTILRRRTGFLDRFLLGDASETAEEIDQPNRPRFAEGLSYLGNGAWPDECDDHGAPDRKASSPYRSPDEVTTFSPAGKTLR
jgi:hypothetical protein